jgi:hypothetical protein
MMATGVGDPVDLRRIERADAEPGLFADRAARHQAGLEHLRGQFHHAADGAFGADNAGDHLGRHGVLGCDQQAVVGEIGLDEFGQPTRIIGFGGQQDPVELVVQGADICQMQSVYRDVEILGLGADRQAVRPHRFHMRRPLVDHGDVEPGADEVGGDATAVGAGGKDSDFLGHWLSTLACGLDCLADFAQQHCRTAGSMPILSY